MGKLSKLKQVQKGLKEQVSNIISEDENSENTSIYKSDVFYSPKPDKSGNVDVEIRFLPTIDDEGNVKIFQEDWKHYLRIGGTKLTVPCLTAVKSGSCPVCNHNKELYSDAVKEKMGNEGRFIGKKWICNILIVKDPEEPSNEGKVFLYSIGKKIYQKVTSELKDDPTLLDPEEGYNFKLKIENAGVYDRKKRIYSNYDSCGFSRKASAIGKDEDEILSVLELCHSFEEFQKQYEVEPEKIEKDYNDYLEKAEGTKRSSTVKEKKVEKIHKKKVVKKPVEEDVDVDEVIDELDEDDGCEDMMESVDDGDSEDLDAFLEELDEE